MCTECARNCQGSSANSGHDQTIKNALQARSSDQDRILDDQDFDPGRGRFHRRVLGDYPLILYVYRDAEIMREKQLKKAAAAESGAAKK